MKKYNTRPIDFTGCHPVIAEHLKRGEAIECKVWDDLSGESQTGYVIGFSANEGVLVHRHAEPIPRKVKRIMPPERAIRVLIAAGWKFDNEGDLVGYGNSVPTDMFKLLGKPLSDPKVSSWSWPPCIIEEVEDDE